MSFSISKNKKARIDSLLPSLLAIPVVSHWILPAGPEYKLYVNTGLFYFYIPNICYILYLLLYSRLNENIIDDKGLQRSIVRFSIVFFAFSVLHTIVSLGGSRLDDLTYILVNNFCCIYIPFVFFAYPVGRSHLESTKWIMLFAWFWVTMQVVLYSLGYAVVGPDTLTDESDYAGIFRVHTTVGAATGSAIVVSLLGIILTSYYAIGKRLKMAVLLLTTIAVFYSVSRGAIVTWCVYLLITFYKDYYKTSKFSNKLLLAISLTLAFYALDHYGVFDPIEYRNELKDSSNFASGREEFNQEVLRIFDESNYMGVGSGQIYPDKSIIHKIKMSHYVGVHNVYLLYLGELGLFGFIFIVVGYFMILKRIEFRSTMALMIPIILVVNYNTEMVFAWAEYLPLMMFYFLMCINQNFSNIKNESFVSN